MPAIIRPNRWNDGEQNIRILHRGPRAAVMPSVSELKLKVFKPGEEVPASGVYKVSHDSAHRDEHEITGIIGELFPLCNRCGSHARFKLVHAAQHMKNHEFFNKAW